MAMQFLQLVFVPVSDQDRAKSFYVDVLGFEVLADEPMGPDRRWLQVGPKGAETSIVLATWLERIEPGAIENLVFQTDDIEADVTELRERGLELVGDGIQDMPWARVARFDDPDGNRLAVQTRLADG
jgi:catechol 2,3-dioxygenase-like lactoylglutathione lyase family enzyme